MIISNVKEYNISKIKQIYFGHPKYSKSFCEIQRKIFPTSTSFLTSWFGNCTNWIYILVIRGRIILLRQLIWFKYYVQKFSMRGMKTCYNLRSFSLFILFFFTFWRNWHDYCQDPRFNAKIFQISHILLTEPIVMHSTPTMIFQILKIWSIIQIENMEQWRITHSQICLLCINIIFLFMENCKKPIFTCPFYTTTTLF